jgi:hypothetical protein
MFAHSWCWPADQDANARASSAPSHQRRRWPAARDHPHSLSAPSEAAQRRAGLHPDVEHATAGLQVGVAIPAQQARGEIVEIEVRVRQQGIQQAQRLGAVVGPGAGRHAVRRLPVRGRRHVDLGLRRQPSGRSEFIGHAEGVADQQADEPALQTLSQGQARLRHRSR